MTRLIAGTAGGRRLHTPLGRETRPTADRVREALFSSLGDLCGAAVLDLYAGSGAVGLEALSRGARCATFVESSAPALAALRRNIAELALEGAQVVAADVASYLARVAAEAFDVIFADPPYALDIDDILAAAAGLLAPGGTLVVERGSRGREPSWPTQLGAPRGRRYGEATLWYLRHP